jgi:hypothetical protein
MSVYYNSDDKLSDVNYGKHPIGAQFACDDGDVAQYIDRMLRQHFSRVGQVCGWSLEVGKCV